MSAAQLRNLKIKAIKKEFHILFSRKLNEQKKTESNTLVSNFFVSILEKMKIEMLQFLLSIFISVEKRMVIWVYGLAILNLCSCLFETTRLRY